MASSQLSVRRESARNHLRSDLDSLVRKSYYSGVSPGAMAITARATGSVPPLYVVAFDGGGISASAELQKAKAMLIAPEASLSVKNVRLV